jgi:hypothetical protein
MTKLSIMESATAGFSLFAKRPISMIVLILFWVIVGVGPALFAVALALPGFIDAAQSMSGTHANADPANMRLVQAFMLKVFGLILPVILWFVVVQAIFNAAVYRAVIEPQKRGFAYLRLGADELRQFFGGILLGLLLMVAYIAAWIGFFAIAMGAKAVGHPWQNWIIALGAILVACLFIWGIVRFSLALPATFGEKRIAIFDSLRLTKGNFWRLVAMALLLFVFLIGLSIAGGIVRVILTASLGGMGGPGMNAHGMYDMQGLTHLRDALHGGPAAIAAALGPAIIASILVQALVQGFTHIVTVAPFAKAYVQLSGRGDGDVHKEF